MTNATASPASAGAEIRAAHELVSDLFAPLPRYYWRELAGVGTAAWAAFILAAAVPDSFALTATLVAIAAALWFRAVVMVHELTHQRRDEIPGFHLGWNLIVGIAWMLPSVMYEVVHNGHHRKTTFGTPDDPEYISLAGRPWAVIGYLAFALVAFPAMALRFLVGAPISWFVRPLRRFLIRSGSSYTINLRFARKMSRKERRRLFAWECAILLAWWPPLALTIAGVVHWQWLPCWYAIYTLSLFVNRLRMLSAHRFTSDGTATDHLGQFRDSLDTPSGWWAELWAPLGLRYHALHHLFPTLPFHNMRTAYRRLVVGLPVDSFYHQETGRGLISALRNSLNGSSRWTGTKR